MTDVDQEEWLRAAAAKPAFDSLSWEIGRNWCKPKNFKCEQCSVDSYCPKIGMKECNE